MSRGVNKVILVGHLGKDPESRSKPDGTPVVSASMATSESWKDKQTGEQMEKTEWHNLVFFRRQAEIAAQYLRKGTHLYIEGQLQTRKWQDKEGKDRYTTEIVVRDFTMLGGKQGSERQEPAATAAAAPAEKAFEDDDIPF